MKNCRRSGGLYLTPLPPRVKGKTQTFILFHSDLLFNVTSHCIVGTSLCNRTAAKLNHAKVVF